MSVRRLTVRHRTVVLYQVEGPPFTVGDRTVEPARVELVWADGKLADPTVYGWKAATSVAPLFPCSERLRPEDQPGWLAALVADAVEPVREDAPSVADADALAARSHAGRVDKAGRPYVVWLPCGHEAHRSLFAYRDHDGSGLIVHPPVKAGFGSDLPATVWCVDGCGWVPCSPEQHDALKQVTG